MVQLNSQLESLTAYDTAGNDFAASGISLADFLNIRNDFIIQSGNSCRFPVGLFNIGAELLGMTKGRILTGDIFPQIPYAAVANLCIAHRSVILISVDRSLCAAAVCYEYQIVFG